MLRPYKCGESRWLEASALLPGVEPAVEFVCAAQDQQENRNSQTKDQYARVQPAAEQAEQAATLRLRGGGGIRR